MCACPPGQTTTKNALQVTRKTPDKHRARTFRSLYASSLSNTSPYQLISFLFSFLAFLYNLSSYHINNSPPHTHTLPHFRASFKSPDRVNVASSHLSISAPIATLSSSIAKHTPPARHCRCHGFRDLAARARPNRFPQQPNDMLLFLFFFFFPIQSNG